jgi:hypothetical protein
MNNEVTDLEWMRADLQLSLASCTMAIPPKTWAAMSELSQRFANHSSQIPFLMRTCELFVRETWEDAFLSCQAIEMEAPTAICGPQGVAQRSRHRVSVL